MVEREKRTLCVKKLGLTKGADIPACAQFPLRLDGDRLAGHPTVGAAPPSFPRCALGALPCACVHHVRGTRILRVRFSRSGSGRRQDGRLYNRDPGRGVCDLRSGVGGDLGPSMADGEDLGYGSEDGASARQERCDDGD